MVTDPERLLKKPSSPVAELLMRAGKEEKPSVAVLRRSARAAVAAAALGAATASTSAAATAGGSASAGIGLAVLAKWLGIGALAGVIASPVVHTLVSAPAAQPAAPLRVLATDAPPPPRTQPESMGNRGTPVAVHALEPQPQAVRDVQRVVPQAAASGSSDVVSGTDNALLAAEVELVERGRAALQRG
ncbi:MAG TPA: hypothetical protein VGK73_40785, partial [Polyangiaceae bacterium]